MSNPLSILLVGDSDKDTGLLESILRKGGLDTKVNRISTKKDFGQALKEKNFDAIVCDLHIARSGGRSYFELFKNAGIDLPFFFISDSLDIDVAAELITAGAHDFIEKDRLFRLVPALIRELRAAQERKESQEKHARQEKQAKDALLGAIRQGPYGVGLFDSDDRLVSWNEQYRRHFEPEIELSEGKKFEDMLRASITHGKIDVPDGDIDKWVEWRLSKHRSPCGPIEMNFNGRAVLVDEHRTSDDGMILFVVDISAIKEAETTLQNREALLQAILDNSPSTIVVKDLDRRYSLVNEAYGERIGMSPDQFVGKKTEDIFPPEISEKIAELDRRVLEGERVSVTRELAHDDDDTGEGRTYLDHRFPIRNSQGDILAIGIISTDISEQKRIEQELRKARDQLEIRVAERTEELRAEISERERAEKSARENEALLRAIFDNSTAFLHVKTPDGKYVIGNNAFLEWAGIDQQDFAGKTAFDISSKKQAGKASKYDRQVAETGKPATFERETIYADGEVGMMQVIKFPIPDSDGTISRIGTLATDITDLKNAERAHRESEAALRAIFDHSDALIQLKDADGKYLLANNAFLEWSGMSPEDYIGKTVEDHAARGLAEQIAGYDRTVLETGQSVNVEQSTEHEDGQARVMHLTKFPIPDANGKITRIGTLATDITQIKKAEEALRERERLLRAVIDNLPSAVSLMDADQCITLVNAEWARNHGVDPEFAIGKPLPEIGSEQEIEQAAAHDNRVLESGNPFEFEIETVRSDGLPQTFVCVKFPIPGQDGTPIGIGSTFTNITERKRAEEALRWSERDLRGILDNMVDTFVRTDRNGRIIMVSPSVSQLLGTTTEETLGREIRSFFADPAGYDELISQLGKNDGELESHEMKFQRPDGVEVWVLATARYYFDDDGDIAGIEGVTHDITMRKRAEEALHRSEDRFRDFAEATSDWMWESDADMRITYVSARLFETTGLMPKNVVGKTWEELRIADDDDERWAAHKDLVGARKPFRDLEYCLINDAGERRTLRVSGKPRFDETGEFLGYRGTGTDVTQQRAAEKREARTRQRFLDAIETVPVGFALFDSEDRLALWNKLYESTGAPEFDLRTGISFEEIIHQSVENGAIGNAAGREDEWIEKRLEQHRNPTGPFMVLRGGRWLQIREHKTPDNSTLLVVVDITDLQRAEESLRESERQLKAFINSIPDIAWLKDAENRFIAVNESFARLAGREISAIIGKTDLDIWPPDLAKGYWDNDEEVKWSKDTMRNEEIVEHPDRSRVWHDTIKAPLLDEYDQVVGTVGTGRDVTDRKNAEDELRKLSAAVEQSPAAILITDPDGMLEYANPKYFVTTGFEPDEVLGRTPVFFGSGDANPGLFQRIYRTVGSGREWRSEGRYRRKNGEYYWSSLAVSPITNADGSISHLLGIAEDTSEKRKMDEQLRHAQKLEAVGTLAGGVAHDFNNILTGILGHCHIAVEKMPANADIGFNLDQITVASNRARDLVQQLLAFSRRRESDLRPVGLHAIVDEAVKLVHASIPSTIKIDWHVADDAGVVMADPTQIHQVLLNLCGNASDAIGDKAGEINVKVENITSDSSIPVSQSNLEPGSYARLSVADNGAGMDTYTLDRVFDPFFTTKPVGSGTGLGLAAVHGIIQDHGGGIAVESEPGKGSTFNVYLPCVAAEGTREEEQKETGFGGTERILLVDDERMVLQSIGPYLEHFGYRVEALTSAAAALAVFESMPDEFDIVITDQVMPGMTGDVLAQKVKAIRPNLPIILCTGYAPPAIDSAVGAMGIDEIVGKPIEPSELGLVIRKTLDAISPG